MHLVSEGSTRVQGRGHCLTRVPLRSERDTSSTARFLLLGYGWARVFFGHCVDLLVCFVACLFIISIDGWAS